jgi:hypothetical protein
MSRCGSERWCSMPARFDDSIPFFGNEVIAIGPLHPSETVDEVCAWVFQRRSDNDAAANEMTTNRPDPAHPHDHFQQIPGERWLLPMGKILSPTQFISGQAFAVAVALMTDSGGNQRVTWWGQPVDLFESELHVLKAHEAGALGRDPLNSPAPFPPTAAA